LKKLVLDVDLDLIGLNNWLHLHSCFHRGSGISQFILLWISQRTYFWAKFDPRNVEK